MNTYKPHRFPPDIISYVVWLYYRFNLSHRDIENLLAERGITVSREAIRLWCIKFGLIYSRRLERKHRGYGDTIHSTEQYENTRAEQSHEATRVRERGMRKFKSTRQSQQFLGAHAAISNLFNLGRQLVRAEHYRNLRETAFAEWSSAVA
jgi:transposase-like protein